MVTISENKKPKLWTYASAQLQYAVTYVIITLFVLLFLNIYCAQANEFLFRQSKFISLQERANLTASEIAATGQINADTASSIAFRTGSRLARVVVTDYNGNILYDSTRYSDPEAPTPSEVFDVLFGESPFTWYYEKGVMRAAIAVPIYMDSQICGSVYMLEVDNNDGKLLLSLYRNILTTTLVLGAFLVIFSIFYVRRYGRRLKKIMTSMRIIQEGDFSHKIEMGGNDELAFLAEEFNYLTERLQISESKRRQFVSDASHELKTPLTVILTNAEILQESDWDATRTDRFVDNIRTMAEQMRGLVEGLLELARVDNGAVRTAFAAVDFSRLVSEALLPFEPLFFEQNLQLESEIQDRILLHGSERHLCQVVDILLDNAQKYSSTGGRTVVRLRRQGRNHCVLTVANQGMPIPQQELRQIFKRFYRVDPVRSMNRSYGLGLSIAETIVREHQGKIWAESRNGYNVFSVQFPISGHPERNQKPAVD